MIADTIIVVMMVIPSSPQPKENRFAELFKEADAAFEKEYNLKDKLKEASRQSAISAEEKTAKQRDKALKSVDFMETYQIYLKKRQYGTSYLLPQEDMPLQGM